jgi:hypothetical protein
VASQSAAIIPAPVIAVSTTPATTIIAHAASSVATTATATAASAIAAIIAS